MLLQKCLELLKIFEDLTESVLNKFNLWREFTNKTAIELSFIDVNFFQVFKLVKEVKGSYPSISDIKDFKGGSIKRR